MGVTARKHWEVKPPHEEVADMKRAKLLQLIALWAISALAIAGAYYLECECDPGLRIRLASHGDCLEARIRHNDARHGGMAIAICSRELR